MKNKNIIWAKIEASGAEFIKGDPEALYPWWSFTKTAIAACVLRLADENKLDIDQAMPGVSYTPRQLLQHRAGIPEYGRLQEYHDAVKSTTLPWSEAELLKRVGYPNLDFQPEHGWCYSNTGYFLIRRFIEETLDQALGSVLNAYVFAPLGLLGISMAETPEGLENSAWGNDIRYHPGWVYHGLLLGSALDAARFLHRLITGGLLTEKSLGVMKQKHLVGGAIPGRPWVEAAYGLGLMAGRMKNIGQCFGHSGAGPESVCAVYHFADLEKPCTAAAFSQGIDEGITEQAVAELALSTSPPDYG